MKGRVDLCVRLSTRNCMPVHHPPPLAVQTSAPRPQGYWVGGGCKGGGGEKQQQRQGDRRSDTTKAD